jgi:hypothetical protein
MSRRTFDGLRREEIVRHFDDRIGEGGFRNHVGAVLKD